jgi:hypothetical protein
MDLEEEDLSDDTESLPGSLVASPADIRSVGSDVPVGRRQVATEDIPPSVFQDKKILPPLHPRVRLSDILLLRNSINDLPEALVKVRYGCEVT